MAIIIFIFCKKIQTKILKKPGLTGPTGRERAFGLNFFKTIIIMAIQLFILFKI
jgi:hypothetical protein